MTTIIEYDCELKISSKELLFPPRYFQIETNGYLKGITESTSDIRSFLNELYTFPPKFKIKWGTIDDLEEDEFASFGSKKLTRNSLFLRTIENDCLGNPINKVSATNYEQSDYLKAYLNHSTATKFYKDTTKPLQNKLQTIPVYMILNGQEDIVLAHSNNSFKTTDWKANLYSFCGSFDPYSKGNSRLGFFFFSRNDAELYLSEVARTDIMGTKVTGLSIHCFDLGTAYRITREYHPTIDFRFIPDLEELNSLITSNIGKSDFLFENDQQQLRYRSRILNPLPFLGILGRWVSPFMSFIENNEYFKGTPIYIVRVSETPKTSLLSPYYKAVNFLDTVYAGFYRYLDLFIGCKNNWILQGSLQDQKLVPTLNAYIFFNKDQAESFCKKNEHSILRYASSRSEIMSSMIRTPTVLTYNLEDFLEVWEENLLNGKNFDQEQATEKKDIFSAAKEIYFIPSPKEESGIKQILQQSSNRPLEKVQRAVTYKCRKLIAFTKICLEFS